MTAAAATLGAMIFGLGSAVVPVLNAEAYALVTAARANVWFTLAVAVALAVGQTSGKLVLFELARRGSGLIIRRTRKPSSVLSRWSVVIDRRLASRRTGVPLVLAAAVVGLPPLAAVCVAAGASAQRRRDFAVACLIGRTARFTAIAVPAAIAFGR